jgi:hypothetical protein
VGQPANGQALITVTPDMQSSLTPALGPGVYYWEARAVLSDGTVSTQAYGAITARASLFTQY